MAPGITRTRLVDTQSHNTTDKRGAVEADGAPKAPVRTIVKPKPAATPAPPPVHKVDIIKAGKRVQAILQ